MKGDTGILVTGGAGYIGSHCARRLHAEGYRPIAIDSLDQGHPDAIPEIPLIKGNMSDRAKLSEIIRKHHVSAVFHFAANCCVGESVTSPERYYRNNVVNSLALLDTLIDEGVGRIIFSSSCAVYGEPTEIPIPETAPTDPTNPYGRTKLAFEHALESYRNAYDLRYASLRYFNAAGADPEGQFGECHDPETHLIPLLLRTASEQETPFEIYGDDYDTPDGTCIRDFVHVDDLIEAHLLCLEHLEDAPSGIYNVGTGRGVSVSEVVRCAETVMGRSVPLRIGPRREGDPPILVADPSRIQQELGWKPRSSSLETIVETAWHWHRTHPNGYT